MKSCSTKLLFFYYANHFVYKIWGKNYKYEVQYHGFATGNFFDYANHSVGLLPLRIFCAETFSLWQLFANIIFHFDLFANIFLLWQSFANVIFNFDNLLQIFFYFGSLLQMLCFLLWQPFANIIFLTAFCKYYFFTLTVFCKY